MTTPEQMTVMREFAPAKVNLSLKVKGRRADGYHELQSLVVFAGCGDALSGEKAQTSSLAVGGPFAHLLTEDDDNLVLKAARLLSDYLREPVGAAMELEKNLPVASGIGGGSADAAAALRLIARLNGRQLPPHALASLALCIGADVPVCLDTMPALMWGKGELMRRIDTLPHFWLVLVNPHVAVETGPVFKALAAPLMLEREIGPELPLMQDFEALLGWLSENGNDLEAPARTLAPVIADVLSALGAVKDCRLARMSGSGATCFGLFAEQVSAERAAAALRVTHPDWWVAAAKRL